MNPHKLSIKNHFFESQLYVSRLMVAVTFICVVVILLWGRLFYLQWISHEKYKTLSDNNRIELSPIAPSRGLVLDRNGVILAENKIIFNLEITPEQTQNLEKTITELQKILPIQKQDITKFNKLLAGKHPFESVPIYTRLTETELSSFAESKHLFRGVDIVARLVRHYPFGKTFAHVVGYLGRINEEESKKLDPSLYRGATHIGKTGIEKFYETLLRGKSGYQAAEINASGESLRTLKKIPPVAGRTLTLTLDSRLQLKAYAAFQDKKGAVVAINPNTGEVLAFVSNPSFDPNLFVQGIDTDSYQALQEAPTKPLFDRALRGQYPPGSTIKPFVALLGLETGLITPDLSLLDPGYYQLPWQEHRYRDWRPEGHGEVNLEKAIVESCDTYFYQLARRLGINTLHSFLDQFGFGKATGIDISGERTGLLPSPAWKKKSKGKAWYLGETLITGIGQGYMLATPLQLAASTAQLAMRGKPVAPHLLLQEGNQLPQAITLKNRVHWDFVINAMEKVVHSPTGTAWHLGRELPFTIAGKTGTSQLFTIGQHEKYHDLAVQDELRDHAIFIGFAPSRHPKIALAAIVENGDSGAALPIAKVVFKEFFSLLY